MKVLFVCLGNICRSPTAEGIFTKLVKNEGLESLISCDSAGTSAYHSGEAADGRMQMHASERGYKLTSLARQFISEDLERFDLVLTMDSSNYENAKAIATDQRFFKKIVPMTNFCKIHNVDEVPDPYYGGDSGFDLVIDILEDSCSELLKSLKKDLKNG